METTKYEKIRNDILLFFYERLLEKKKPQTIHTLSCLFGDKRFSKEMRELLGGKAGLKQLLSEHPSIFIIKDNLVELNPDGSIVGKYTKGDKSHEKNAKEYFKDKMLKYGVGVEVPIKTLYGHRSQASTEVRFVSGHLLENFIDFLKKHPDTFRIIKDNVFLVDDENKTDLSALQSNVNKQKIKPNKPISSTSSRTSDNKIVEPRERLKSFNMDEDIFLDNLCDRNIPNSSMKSYYGSKTSFASNNWDFTDHTWKTEVLKNSKIISNFKQCLSITNIILKSAQNDGPVVISVDCKGHNLGEKGEISLIEICTTYGEIYVFDVLTTPEIIIAGIKTLLEHEKVIKIMNNCSKTSANLYFQFNVLLRNVFDVQIAYRIIKMGIQPPNHVSFNSLCKHYKIPISPLKYQKILRRDKNYWKKRPIDDKMLLFAVGDVLVLMNNKLYVTMAKEIKPINYQNFSDLSTEQILMYIKPDIVKKRRIHRKINTDIVILKEKLSKVNKRIVLSNREIYLLKYIDLTEEDIEHLKGYQRVDKKLEKLISSDNETSTSEDEQKIKAKQSKSEMRNL